MTTKPSALGSNPFAAARARPGGTEIISTEEEAPAAVAKADKGEKTKTGPKRVQKTSKEQVGVYLPPELADYARDAIYATGRRYTMGDLIAEFLPAAIADLEKRFNDGKPFPPRPPEAEKLTPGPARLNPRRRRQA